MPKEKPDLRGYNLILRLKLKEPNLILRLGS